MKRFKLIKEYPNSPKLGSIIVDTNPNNGAKDCWFSENWGKSGATAFFLSKSTNPESHPEFWEEIKPQYEILEFKSSKSGNEAELSFDGRYMFREGATSFSFEELIKDQFSYIKKIKRLSDNQVFELGDKIKCQNSHIDKPEKITEIKLNKEGTPCLFTSSFRTNGINFVKAIKIEPLFMTHDGVEIYPGDKMFLANKRWDIVEYSAANLAIFGKPDKGNVIFSTEEKAKQYIYMNKPKYSIKDILEIQQHNNVQILSLLTKK